MNRMGLALLLAAGLAFPAAAAAEQGAVATPGTPEAAEGAEGDRAGATPAVPSAPFVAAAVTVTARPVLEEIRREPLAGSVTVVGARQIEDLNAGDPAAALRRVPGLVVSRYNVVGSYGGGDGGGVFARHQRRSKCGKLGLRQPIS